jgi:hypothetical protein
MKIRKLLENNVVDAAERFRRRRTHDERRTGYGEAVEADIASIIQPRWSKKYYHDLLDQNTYHKEDDYITRLYWSLPEPGEPMEPQNRIAHTILMNNKDAILGMLEDQLRQLTDLKAKYKGIFIFTNMVDEYITVTDMLLSGFEKYIKSY